jgi:NAD+ diphosphatase
MLQNNKNCLEYKIMECELCAFNNPKGAATAAILRDNKLLVLKRNEEPFKGMWDLPGGFMSAGETPDETIKREIKEELGIEARAVLIKSVPGTAFWKDKEFPIISFFCLVDIGNENIKLNNENSEFDWVSLADIKTENIAYDSNQKFISWLKKNFTFNLKRVRELISDLDSNAAVNEQSLYLAKLNGYLATRYDGEKLIGMGWIFPRQTLLRKQAVIEDMIVDSVYRGKGLGRELLNDLVVWAKENGVEVIELTSNPKRIAANELYKKHGFKLHPTNHYLYNIKYERQI